MKPSKISESQKKILSDLLEDIEDAEKYNFTSRDINWWMDEIRRRILGVKSKCSWRILGNGSYEWTIDDSVPDSNGNLLTQEYIKKIYKESLR